MSNRSPGSNPGFSAKNPGNVAFPGFFVCGFLCGEKAVNALTKSRWIQTNPSPKIPVKNQRPHRLIHRHAKVTTTAAAQRIPKTINPMRSSPSTAAKSCRNRMCRQGGKYAVWVDFFHGGQENMLQTAALSEKCTKIPGSLTLPGDFLLYARQESNL